MSRKYGSMLRRASGNDVFKKYGKYIDVEIALNDEGKISNLIWMWSPPLSNTVDSTKGFYQQREIDFENEERAQAQMFQDTSFTGLLNQVAEKYYNQAGRNLATLLLKTPNLKENLRLSLIKNEIEEMKRKSKESGDALRKLEALANAVTLR